MTAHETYKQNNQITNLTDFIDNELEHNSGIDFDNKSIETYIGHLLTDDNGDHWMHTYITTVLIQHLVKALLKEHDIEEDPRNKLY